MNTSTFSRFQQTLCLLISIGFVMNLASSNLVSEVKNANVFEGRWKLAGYQYVNDELELNNKVADQLKAEQWLKGEFKLDSIKLKVVSGSELTVKDAKYFDKLMVEKPQVLMYDLEGVETDEFPVMDGQLHTNQAGDIMYCRPNKMPKIDNFTYPNCSIIVRYDDGDTVICESFQVKNNKLYRITSVITDELYLSRSILEYEKITP
jgi:hypothetical protein